MNYLEFTMMKLKKRASAHAGSRIVNNGHSSVPTQDVSGGIEGKESLGAGSPENSRNVSGEVSEGSGAHETPQVSSPKRSSRRRMLNRNLTEEFSPIEELIGEPSDFKEAADTVEELVEDLPVFENLSELDLNTEAGRESALQYLRSEAVTRWMIQHGSQDALQEMINDLLKMPKKAKVRPTKVDEGARHSPLRPVALKSEAIRKRVPPAKGSVAELGDQYRLGQPSMVGALATANQEKLHHVIKFLAGAAAGVPAETPPIGCKTQDQHDLDELASTAQRILQRRPDLAHLPRAVRLRKIASMASRELHKAELSRISRKPKATSDGSGSDTPPSSGPSGGSSDSGSESVGDTIGTSSSGESVGSYDRRDHFVENSVSSCASDSDSDQEHSKQRKKRERQRMGSMNSLGTPRKVKTGSDNADAAVAPASPVSPGVMMFGDDDLKMWTIGTAAYKQGLNWEAYVHHKQAYDNYMQHKGKWSERTFKSVIHAKLVPTVCATCGFLRGKWHKVDDAQLILKLEKVLRPSRSTDFAVELRALRLVKHKHSDEPLISRYEVFAEKFIYKCAEAEDAGKRIKPNVIKAAFKAEVEKENVLKHWLQEVQWNGVERAHRRLLRKLREARSVEQLFHGSKPELKTRGEVADGSEDDMNGRVRGPRQPRYTQPKRHLSAALLKRRISNSLKKRVLPTGSRFNHGSSRIPAGSSGAARAPLKSDRGPKIREWNYDKRGASWHTDADLYECYDRPCQRPFCQRCRLHGHTAEYCRKADDTPGLTREGYAQENAKGKAAIQAPPPTRRINSSKRAVEERSSDSDANVEESASRSGRLAQSNHGGSRRDQSSQYRGGSDDDLGSTSQSRSRICL
jgi:hypothetical protein